MLFNLDFRLSGHPQNFVRQDIQSLVMGSSSNLLRLWVIFLVVISRTRLLMSASVKKKVCCLRSVLVHIDKVDDKSRSTDITAFVSSDID